MTEDWGRDPRNQKSSIINDQSSIFRVIKVWREEPLPLDHKATGEGTELLTD